MMQIDKFDIYQFEQKIYLWDPQYGYYPLGRPVTQAKKGESDTFQFKILIKKIKRITEVQ